MVDARLAAIEADAGKQNAGNPRAFCAFRARI